MLWWFCRLYHVAFAHEQHRWKWAHRFVQKFAFHLRGEPQERRTYYRMALLVQYLRDERFWVCQEREIQDGWKHGCSCLRLNNSEALLLKFLFFIIKPFWTAYYWHYLWDSYDNYCKNTTESKKGEYSYLTIPDIDKEKNFLYTIP